MENESKPYEYWLHCLPGIGDRTIAKLLQNFGHAKEVYHASPDRLMEILGKKRAAAVQETVKSWNLHEKYEEMRRKRICFVTQEEMEYPARLKTISYPPYALYYIGELPKEEAPAAAIIGARECSEYGRFMAEAFAGELADKGVSIISGMARGVDGIAQQAAIKNGGKTYAVLGSGADVCYPASNRGLYEEILASGGGILSVFPPGTQPQKTQFPERNRIVAGLSDLLLVVEARQKSGTWITVDMALEQGKNVYAIPRRLTDRLSDGCNLLIRQGAGIALAPADLVAELFMLHNRRELGDSGKAAPKENRKPEAQMKGEADDISHKILSCLDFYPLPADEIQSKMEERYGRIELPLLLTELVGLCIGGKAKQAAGNYFMRTGKNQ